MDICFEESARESRGSTWADSHIHNTAEVTHDVQGSKFTSFVPFSAFILEDGVTQSLKCLPNSIRYTFQSFISLLLFVFFPSTVTEVFRHYMDSFPRRIDHFLI